ncbi:hypothetical protein REPUB_Repub10bG0082100 [Reevesia pubescens]
MDRSNTHPRKILKDVLFQVDNLMFLVDFYIIYMDDDEATNQNFLLLGRPIMKMAKTKINVFKGSLTMEVNDEVAKFLVFDEEKVKNDPFTCFAIDMCANFFQGISKGRAKGMLIIKIVKI